MVDFNSYPLLAISLIVTNSLFTGALLFSILRRVRPTPSLNARHAPFTDSYRAVSISIGGLNFRDALNFERASNQIASKTIAVLNDNGLMSSSLVVSLQAIDMAQSMDIILAQFPEATRELLKNGRAAQICVKNGEKLLVAVDQKGRQFISQAKQVDPALISKLSGLAAVVVGAAHIIAGYDNAKTLKRIDQKLDVLISQNANKMVATLEAVFESLKEQTSTEMSESGRLHLVDLKLKLKTLRCHWFREVTSALRSMEDPGKIGFLAKLFVRRAALARLVQNELNSQEEPLYLIRFSATLEQLIGQALGEDRLYQTCTIPDILRQAQDLSGLVQERRAWIAALSGDQVMSSLFDACERFRESLAGREGSFEILSETEQKSA